MQCTNSYLVPEYYPAFVCKTSACRHPCCEGWKITISMEDYFRLVGAECSGELRGKIDCALKVTGGTADGRYAVISADYTGRCRLHREDGLCAVQAELGESCLPAICRYYPRAVRRSYKNKCCCSNSCEAVIESMSAIKGPLLFIEKEIAGEREPDGDPFGAAEFEVQQECIGIIQDRRYALPERISFLCDYLSGTRDGKTDEVRPDIAEALDIQRMFTDLVASGSKSMEDYYPEVVRFYRAEENDAAGFTARYLTAKKAFEENFPEWQTLFEHIIVNHMFYDEFPFLLDHKDMRRSFVPLAAVYSFLRYSAVGYCYNHPSGESFADLAAAVFRLIEHSGFDRNAAVILGKLNWSGPEKLKSLVLI